MKNILAAIMILATTIPFSCKKEDDKTLETGDLLFREAISTGLSKAIDQVTQTDSATHFSHIGMVEMIKQHPTVLHASPNGGTCRVSLQEFSHPDGDSTKVVIYRLKKPWQKSIPNALSKAKAMLGKPYNFSYILNDTSNYCSEFIFLAFEHDSIFEMNPMTFKDPETGEFASGWIDYYKKLGVEIPEGLPGCNPNGMAASEKLERIGILQ